MFGYLQLQLQLQLVRDSAAETSASEGSEPAGQADVYGLPVYVQRDWSAFDVVSAALPGTVPGTVGGPVLVGSGLSGLRCVQSGST